METSEKLTLADERERLRHTIDRVEDQLDSCGVPREPVGTPVPGVGCLSGIDQADLIGKIPTTLEHTLLRPDATLKEIEELCKAARKHQFFGVCVQPVYARPAAKLLRGTGCAVVTVVGFPHGSNTSETKAFEASAAIGCDRDDPGADELDMVIPLGLLKAGDYFAVHRDISLVVEASRGRPVKVIIEATSLDKEDDKVAACLLAARAGASFVKTSTGFGGGGATVDDVKLMRAVVPELGVKAAGRIGDLDTVMKMIRAGADRIGCSASVKITSEIESCSARA